MEVRRKRVLTKVRKLQLYVEKTTRKGKCNHFIQGREIQVEAEK